MGKGGMMTWDKEDLKNYLTQAKRITQKWQNYFAVIKMEKRYV